MVTILLKEERDSKRTCGTCSECCKTLKIEELDKPVGRRCPHQQRGGGCEKYTSRPLSCRDFGCEYLYGVGDKRPNETGIVLDLRLGRLMQMWESRHGALDTEYAVATRQYYLDQGHWVSYLHFRGQKELYVSTGASEEEIQEAREDCQKNNMKIILPARAP